MRRGQSYSVDVVLAIVIFGFVSVAITSFALLSQPDVDKLQNSASRVVNELEGTYLDCGIVLENSSIDNESIACLFNKSYEDFKEAYDIEHNFCIYLEDEKGQILKIQGKNGWGSAELRVGGDPCNS